VLRRELPVYALVYILDIAGVPVFDRLNCLDLSSRSNIVGGPELTVLISVG